MNPRRLLWGRIVPAVLLLVAYSRPGARAQDARPSDASGTVRVYVVDRRAGPMAGLQDTAASLTLRYRTGRGETVLLARAPGERPPGEGTEGMIRGLIGSGEFVELFWSDGRVPSPSAAPEERHEGGHPLPAARDVLRRAHRGPCFAASIPASHLADVTSAWVTVRRGSVSWSSEEFQGPSAPVESDEALLSAVDRTLHSLEDRVNEGASFMMLHPQAVILVAELAKLAPAGFHDDRGDFERERQWCLGVARAIDNSVAYGDWGQVATLSQQCRPRVRAMESLRHEPERPTVPTLDHQP
jgi:hypothetical protein